MNTALTVISLGAGVQSTTMALMAAHGEFEHMPDCAIFADTGWEPKAVYDHLDWLRSPNILPFPVHVVNAGNLRDKVLQAGYSDVPWFTSEGMGRRQCTKVFKLYPFRAKAKTLAGVTHGRELGPSAIESWIGISLDEAHRVKPSNVQYIKNVYPLIDRRMRRWDCYNWLEHRDYPVVRPHEATLDNPPWPPRSACRNCPFMSDEDRRLQRDIYPEEHAQSIADDHAIRNLGAGGLAQFSHRSLKPLDEVDLSTAEDRGQLNMFGNECEGMCGV